MCTLIVMMSECSRMIFYVCGLRMLSRIADLSLTLKNMVFCLVSEGVCAGRDFVVIWDGGAGICGWAYIGQGFVICGAIGSIV